GSPEFAGFGARERGLCRESLHSAGAVNGREPLSPAENCGWHELARGVYLLLRPHSPKGGLGASFRSRRPPFPFSNHRKRAADPPGQALATCFSSRSCWSSPASNISIMMSEPPTNSPFT